MNRKEKIALIFAFAFFFFAVFAHASDRATRQITMLSSTAVTASSAATSSYLIDDYTEGTIYIDVTAESGVSTLDVQVQSSPDNSEWYTFDESEKVETDNFVTSDKIVETGNYVINISNIGKYIRCYYTVTGTSMTFSINSVFKN